MRSAWLITLSVPVVLSGCDLAPTETTAPPPRVRVVNAGHGTTSVTAFLDESAQGLTTEPLPFKTGSDCLLVTDGVHTFAFTQGTATLASVTGTLMRGSAYTVVLVGGSPFRAVLLSDTAATPSGTNGLRFINATLTAGDVYVTATDGSPSASTRAVGGLGVLAQSNEQPAFVFRPVGDTRVRLFDVGTTTAPRSDLNLALLPLSRLASVIFVEKTINEEPGALQFNACR